MLNFFFFSLLCKDQFLEKHFNMNFILNY